MPLTRALINRHGGNRNDTYDAALLDVAQDHLLWHLGQNGHFDDTSLVFKRRDEPSQMAARVAQRQPRGFGRAKDAALCALARARHRQ